MGNAQTRVRQARRHATLSQQELASLVGVHRSAVAQWERVGGCSPTAENLARIAIATSVQYEWLATGRGRMEFRSDLETRDSPALLLNYAAHDEVEARVLVSLRRMKQVDVVAVAEMLEVLARTRMPSLKRVIAFSR